MLKGCQYCQMPTYNWRDERGDHLEWCPVARHFRDGAGVAFGLMGMAEAIRENLWRYEVTCEWCDCKVEDEPLRRGRLVFCDARCVNMFDANP
jgi:hypothetical protein